MNRIIYILIFSLVFSISRDDIYDNSWALIIGIDKYEKVTPNLHYAVDDAEDIHELLINQFGFPKDNVTILKNEQATKQNILKSFRDITKNAKSNDRVLIFFAGHGETYKLPEGGEMGYLLPYDSDKDDLYFTSIPMDEFRTLSGMSSSKHLLFLIDACYGGLASVGTRGLDTKSPNYIEKIAKDKSRQVITAGGRGERAIEKGEWGHSAFTMNLLRGLQDGRADYNSDGIITTNELYMFLKEKVTQDSENAQTPQTGRYTSHEGEFVFIYSEDTTINQVSNNSNQSEDLQLILKKLEALEAAAKLVVVENEEGEKIEKIVPKIEFLKTLVTFPVKNNIPDENYAWVSNGIWLGVECDLSQEVFIYNKSQKVLEKLMEAGFHSRFGSAPMNLKRSISQDLQVKYFVDMELDLNENSEFVVISNLYKTEDGKLQTSHTFINKDIFTIIDEVASQLRKDLDIPEGVSEDLPIQDMLTYSLDAYKEFATGVQIMLTGDFQGGISSVEKAIEIDDTFAMAYLNLQSAYVLTNQGDKREETIKKCMKYIYKLPERYHYLPKIIYFMLKEKPERAYKVMDMHFKTFPYDIGAYDIMLNLVLSKGDYEQAINIHKLVLEVDPTQYDRLIKLGNTYLHYLGDAEKAIEYFNQYLIHVPNDYHVHQGLARAHSHNGDKDKSRESWEMVTLLDPGNIKAELKLIGCDYEGREQIEQQYQLLSECESAKDSVKVYQHIEEELNEYGMIQEVLDNWKIYGKIRASYAMFQEYAFDNIFVPAKYAEIGQTDEAFRLLNEYKDSYSQPWDIIPDAGYIALYITLDDGDNAEKYLDQFIVNLEKTGSQILLDAMVARSGAKEEIAILKGDYDLAITLVDSNVHKDEEQIQRLLARAYRLKGNPEKSKNIIEKICQDHCAPGTEFEAALTYYDLGEHDTARDYLNNYLDHYKNADPTYDELIKAQETLEEWNNE